MEFRSPFFKDPLICQIQSLSLSWKLFSSRALGINSIISLPGICSPCSFSQTKLSKHGTPDPFTYAFTSTILYRCCESSNVLSEEKKEFGKTFPFQRLQLVGTFHFFTSLSSVVTLFLSFFISSLLGRRSTLGSFGFSFAIVSFVSSDILLFKVLSFLIFSFNFNSFSSQDLSSFNFCLLILSNFLLFSLQSLLSSDNLDLTVAHSIQLISSSSLTSFLGSSLPGQYQSLIFLTVFSNSTKQACCLFSIQFLLAAFFLIFFSLSFMAAISFSSITLLYFTYQFQNTFNSFSCFSFRAVQYLIYFWQLSMMASSFFTLFYNQFILTNSQILTYPHDPEKYPWLSSFGSPTCTCLSDGKHSKATFQCSTTPSFALGLISKILTCQALSSAFRSSWSTPHSAALKYRSILC